LLFQSWTAWFPVWTTIGSSAQILPKAALSKSRFVKSPQINLRNDQVSDPALPQSFISAAIASASIVIHWEIDVGVANLQSTIADSISAYNPNVSIKHGIVEGTYEKAFIPERTPIYTEMTSVTTAGISSIS